MEHIFRDLQQFPWRVEVARAVRMNASNEEVTRIARAIADGSFRGQEFQQAVHLFLDLCYTIDGVKIAAIGKDAPTAASNAIQTALGYFLIKRVPWERAELRWIEEASRSKEGSSYKDRWGATKLLVLSGAMRNVLGTQEFASRFQLHGPEAWLEMLRAGVSSLEPAIQGIMERLLELRRYGIKSSFTQQGFLPGGDAAWVMWDIRDFASFVVANTGNQVAQVALATAASQIKDLRVKVERKEETMGVSLPFPASFTWTMNKKAEFHIGVGNGVLSAREIFEQAGKGIHYECIRTKMVFYLYDLIVPLVKLQSLSARAEQASRAQRLLEMLKLAKPPVVDLILPRIKLLEDRSLESDLEQEVEEGERETQRRMVREHEVVAHIRRLPTGHRPSRAARQLALEEFGIVLREDETFVRKHERGKGDRVTGHRAKMRA